MTEPFCNKVACLIRQSVCELGIQHHFGGAYVLCIEGPQFPQKLNHKLTNN